MIFMQQMQYKVPNLVRFSKIFWGDTPGHSCSAGTTMITRALPSKLLAACLKIAWK